jgi:alpha-galactosidase
MFDVQDVRQFVAWGCDYFKYDWSMGEKPHQPGLPHVYYAGRIGAAFGASKRDVVLELSNAAPFGEAANFTEIGNMTRTGSDLIDIWSHDSAAKKMKVADWAMGILDTMDKVRRWQPYNRPGHWNMPCPTRVGMLGGWDEKPLAPSRLTKDEQVTHISLWCLWSAPIIIGCPIDLLDDWTLALLTNDEMLDLDQDALGIQAIDNDTRGGGSS